MAGNKNNNWFEVDKDGLKALQSRKPKFHIIRELIQNAWDEDVTEVIIEARKVGRTVTISVEDDSPIGFRFLKDAYTMFAQTYKGSDPTKRGRFNMGEKQAFAICTKAMIVTTKGTVIFDKTGRHNKRANRESGTEVTVEVNMTKDEYNDLIDFVYLMIPPKHIKTWLNGEPMSSPEPEKEFDVILPTEHQVKDGTFAKTNRKTKVSVYDSKWINPSELEGKMFIYEMGIPVCEIKCEYSIDVSQRIPMGIDRDTVSNSYLQDLFAEVLNQMYDEIPEERISETWVRTAMNDTKRMDRNAIEGVLDKRFGEKRVVATVGDSRSIDEAIAHGYRPVYGSEMGKGEWENAKNNNLIPSSSSMFGMGTCNGKSVEPDENMMRVSKIARAIMKRVYDIDIFVDFVDCGKANTPGATYGGGCLTFYTKKLGKGFFAVPLSARVINLIIHELGHEHGHHTEKAYHEALTKLGAELTMIALEEPEWFDQFRRD